MLMTDGGMKNYKFMVMLTCLYEVDVKCSPRLLKAT